MDDIRDKDYRYRKVGKKTVRFLDQGEQPELSDPEIHDAADERRNDLFSRDLKFLLPRRLLCSFGFIRCLCSFGFT